MSILLLAVLFISCNNSATEPQGKTFTVMFDTGDGASKVDTQTVSENGLARKPDDPTKEGFLFVRWSVAQDGKAAFDFGNNKITADTVIKAVWIKYYNIGENGPAGGYIFYVNPNRATDDWVYLEAAPKDISEKKKWNYSGKAVNTGTAIGKGITNTYELGTDCPAAKACEDYECKNETTGVKYDDWFLPSIDELVVMHNNLRAKDSGGTWEDDTNGTYWSSSAGTDAENKNAMADGFAATTSSGGAEILRTNENFVRPVRFVK